MKNQRANQAHVRVSQKSQYVQDDLGEATLAKLRDSKLFDEGTYEEPTRSGRYISFVGFFNVADNAYDVTGNDYDGDEDDYNDYCINAIISGLKAITLNLEIIAEESKDSLTVTYYTDPHNVDGWAVVVAECLPGGWVECARVKLDSFEGGAAVPSGCEVVPDTNS